MSQSKIIDFPQNRHIEYDPDKFLRFIAHDNEACYIKAKYKDTIRRSEDQCGSKRTSSNSSRRGRCPFSS